MRAAQNGRSTEAEILEILEEAVRPKERIKIGSELAAFGDKHKLGDLNIVREQEPTRIASFQWSSSIRFSFRNDKARQAVSGSFRFLKQFSDLKVSPVTARTKALGLESS